MRTSREISTISYNTEVFLKFKLFDLVKSGYISDWFYIRHFKEEDESSDHFHVWMKPNKLLDTLDFQRFFEEFDPKKPDKPLKCIDFRYSDADNAILYFIHDAKYLAMKGESRKFHYLREDFVFFDEYNFEFLYNHAFRGSDYALKNNQLQAVKDNQDDLSKLIDSGLVPLSMAGNLCAYSNLRYNDKLNKTYRNGRKGHE